MITLKELVVNQTIPEEHQANLIVLLDHMNQFRTMWGNPMTVTSGYRTKEHHIEVYKHLAAKRGVPFDLAKVPMGSKHLTGEACDIHDPDGLLYAWCETNVSILEDIGLWCEVRDDQPRVHFQIAPPKSGSRFFKP